MRTWSAVINFCAAVVIVMLISLPADAARFMLDFNANGSVLEGRSEIEWDIDPNFVTLGGGILYDEDDYTLGQADVTFGSPLQTGVNSRFNMGLQGIFGQVDDPTENADASAVAITLSGAVEPGRIYEMPLELTAMVAGAFGPMAFQDADGFWEFKTTFGLYVLQNRLGAVYIGYRYLNLDLDDEFSDADVSESEFVFGFRFRFGSGR